MKVLFYPIAFSLLCCIACGYNSEEYAMQALSPSYTGIQFSNTLPYNHQMNNLVYDYYYNGGGITIADFNNDGLEDIYFTANFEDNALYQNKGKLQFEEITEKSGVKGKKGWATGTVAVDINQDGWMDLYVCRSGRLTQSQRQNELFINQTDGTFVEKAAEYGLNSAAYSTQALFFDYDLDGDLDLYLLNHNIEKVTVNNPSEFRKKRHRLAGDQFFINENGKYKEITEQSGILSNGIGFGLGVVAEDFNSDGYPDLYVTNDYTEPDYLYYNQKDGTFKEVIKDKTGHISNFSMGVDAQDVNNDGYPDLFVSEMAYGNHYDAKTGMGAMDVTYFRNAVASGLHHQYMTNTFQINLGNGHFSEIAAYSGIAKTGWSWAALFFDMDMDGQKDLFVANGFRRDNSNNDYKNSLESRKKKFTTNPTKDTLAFIEEIISDIPEKPLDNFMFKNEGELQFSDQSTKWKKATKQYANSAAYADFDKDGDLDLVVNNIDGLATVYANNFDSKGHLTVSFEGQQKNRNGIGTKVTIYQEGKLQSQRNYPVRGYQSAVSQQLYFGLNNKGVDSLIVIWPDGKIETQLNISIKSEVLLDYRNASHPISKGPKQPTLFTKHNPDLLLKHNENSFDDFARQSMLPHALSAFGPALATHNAKNGTPTLLYLGGSSGEPGRLVQFEQGESIEIAKEVLDKDAVQEDVDALFFDYDQDGDMDLYVVSGGNEWEHGNVHYQDRLYQNKGNNQWVRDTLALPEIHFSGSVVRPFDFDMDGDQDLLVGARHKAWHYPEFVASQLLVNSGGHFINGTAQLSEPIEGMVTDAVWSDLDQDGQTDFVVVGEWMAPQWYKNEAGSFKKTPLVQNENELLGWWYSIEIEDLDLDGDQDIVLGNLGQNYKYKASADAPFQVYHSDFDQNGSADIVLSYLEEGKQYPLRGKSCSSNQIPVLKKKFKSYDAFGKADLEGVYGKKELSKAKHKKATTFHSILLENKNQIFEVRDLPFQAQWFAIQDICIKDVNQDAIPDLILGGNLMQSEIETPRNDAGKGLVLIGDKNLAFAPLSVQESGVFEQGEIRSIETITIGEVEYLLIAKNNQELTWYTLKGNE